MSNIAAPEITKEELRKRREEFKEGQRVELIEMNDPYRKMEKGLKGTVKFVDDMGTVHISWDNNSSLGALYLIDKIKKISN